MSSATRRFVTGGLVGALLLLLAAGAVVTVGLLAVRSASVDARTSLSESVTFLSEARYEEADQRLTQARDHIGQAVDHLDGFGMAIGRQIPFLGQEIRVMDASLTSASEIAAAMQQMTGYVLSPHDPVFSGQSVDAPSARTLAGVAAEADALMVSAMERMEAAPDARVESVAVMEADLTERARQGVAVTRALHASLTAIAGAAEGGTPFRALFLVTDGATLRPLGGVPLAVIEGRIDSGGIRVGAVTDPSSLDVVLPDEVAAIVGTDPEPAWEWLTALPDGPTTAAVAATATGDEADVVFVVDLVAAGRLLDAFADLRQDHRGFDPLDLSSVVALEAHRDIPDDAERRRHLAGILDHLLGQAVERGPRPRDLYRSIRRILDEDRIVAFSSRPEYQAVFEAEGVDMALGSSPGRVDVAVSNTAGTRLDSFTDLDALVEVGPEECRLHSRMLFAIEAAPPPDLVDPLSSGSDRNEWRLNVYLPPGAELTAVTSDGEPVAPDTVEWEGRRVAAIDLASEFGEGTSAEVEWLGPLPDDGLFSVHLLATVSRGAQLVTVEIPAIDGCES